MDVTDGLICHLNWGVCHGIGQPIVARGEADDGAHDLVLAKQALCDAADDAVEPWAEAAARNDCGTYMPGVPVDLAGRVCAKHGHHALRRRRACALREVARPSPRPTLLGDDKWHRDQLCRIS